MLWQLRLRFPSWSSPLPGGCVVKPPLRTKSLGTKVSDSEYARLEALASTRGQTISEFVRRVPHSFLRLE